MFKPLMFLFLVFQLLPADAAPVAGGCAVPVRQLDIAGIKLSEPAVALQKRFPKAMPLSEGNRHFLFFPPDSGAAFAPDIADIFHKLPDPVVLNAEEAEIIRKIQQEFRENLP